MIKKMIFIIISISVFNFIINSCCTEIDKDYVKIIGFNSELFENNGKRVSSLQNGDTTYVDTLKIQTEIKYDFIASMNYSSNSVLATKCKEWGESGFKNKIQEITFKSSGTFQGKSPNSSLNEFITCNYLYTRSDVSLDSIKNILNIWKGGFLDTFTFYINSKPENLYSQKFKIIFKLENGEYLELEIPEIVWI